ncbi:MAG: hypothetical protein AAF598_00120 [Bacteroidota bacterium]
MATRIIHKVLDRIIPETELEDYPAYEKHYFDGDFLYRIDDLDDGEIQVIDYFLRGEEHPRALLSELERDSAYIVFKTLEIVGNYRKVDCQEFEEGEHVRSFSLLTTMDRQVLCEYKTYEAKGFEPGECLIIKTLEIEYEDNFDLYEFWYLGDEQFHSCRYISGYNSPQDDADFSEFDAIPLPDPEASPIHPDYYRTGRLRP